MNTISAPIVYQIFVDRFYKENSESQDSKSFLENDPTAKWGGDLEGVMKKLDYIQNLGVDIIYLTPIFTSPSYHRYDATDYRSIDPSLGGFESFNKLLAAMHERGMKLIIDVAINHVSDQHPYFKEAVSNPDSKYRNYFCFKNYPNKYKCWQGHRYMPELDLENPEVVEEFISGEDSVINFWIKKGVDGIRLDCANDLGIKVLSLIKERAQKTNPKTMILGEVFNFAPHFLKEIDSLQTYYFTSSIFSLLQGKITPKQFGHNVLQALDAFPYDKLLNCLNMLSSHDYERSLTNLDRDIQKLYMALILQFTLPGVPMIYYGEEIGMEGGKDPFNRAPMKWDESDWNNEIHSFYKKLINLRKSREELSKGKLLELSHSIDYGIVSYLRYSEENPQNFSVITANPSNEPKSFRLFPPYSFLFSDLKLKDLLSSKVVKSHAGYIDVELQPWEFNIYTPMGDDIEDYSFFKRV